jgi:predicted O-methyltransferase YrrM
VAGRNIDRSEALNDYIRTTGSRETDVQRRLRAETKTMRGAGMQIGQDQAQFMALLAKSIGARNALEIGTYTGMSALAVASALPPDGKLIACDVSKEWTDVGRRFWKEAGVDTKIDLRLGPGIETLDGLIKEGRADGFDFAFIDADKSNYDHYYERCLVLVRRGGLILLDNMLWSGRVIDDSDTSEDTVAIRALNAKIHQDDRVDMCLLGIGDGVNMVRKR